MAKPSDRIERLKERILSGEQVRKNGDQAQAQYPDQEVELKIPYRLQARFSAHALVQNYSAIRGQIKDLFIIPMIKADGYGHGAVWAARVLKDQPGLFGLGVATLEEAFELSQELPELTRKVPVILYSGTANWSAVKSQMCQKFGWTATIADDLDWKTFYQNKDYERVAYQLKFNTGMNRLGLSLSRAQEIATQLQKLKPEFRPKIICSHLAQAETPDSPLSVKQLDGFIELKKKFSQFSGLHFSLANSGAIWNSKHWKLAELTDVVRPGISLYGVPPWRGAPVRGLTSVVTLRAQVLKVCALKRGDLVGYGGTYKAKEDQTIAVLGAGYGDGIPRSFSNQGLVWLGEKAERFCGIVSMDLSAVSCHPTVKAGDWAEILGERVDVWTQSQNAQTIPYELLTALAGVMRIERFYE